MGDEFRKSGVVSARVVYSRHYNIGLFGAERLHPFDSRKYGRAWRVLRRRFGRLKSAWVRPEGPVKRAALLAVHSAAYLDRLGDAKVAAKLVEIPPLRFLPGWLVDWLILRPMRWAAMGTIEAARQAMEHGLAVNMGGGYHHASGNQGHGFCAYADVGLAVAELRQTGRLGDADKVVYVDLDAHQGNGVCRTFMDDPSVFIYDQYNADIFPHDVEAQRRIDCKVTVRNGCNGADYLAALRQRLPPFLDSIMRAGGVKLAIYNAGTDICLGDQLGGLAVSAADVLVRDEFVLRQLVERGIATMVLLSGGYSRASYEMVAAMVGFVLEEWGGFVQG